MALDPVYRHDDEEPPPSGGDSSFSPDDDRYDDELRPQRLVDVVGQRDVVKRIGIMLTAAKKRDEPLGHLLLDGPPGLGKTTLLSLIHI